jgi:hypothetical protein
LANIIKNELLKQNETKEKVIEITTRLSLELNVSHKTVARIRDGKHHLSTELCGGYKDWIKEMEEIK